MKETIRRIADAVRLNENNIRDFLNAAFSQIAKDYGLTGSLKCV